MSTSSRRIVSTLAILVLIVQLKIVESGKSPEVGSPNTKDSGNRTRITEADEMDEEDEETANEERELAEFKERYRRLIPYMTYYVANNYVNSQVPDVGSQLTAGDSVRGSPGPLTKKPQRHWSLSAIDDGSIKSNGPRPGRPLSAAGRLQQNSGGKFVPSVQYDPKDIGSDTDYFAPIAYQPTDYPNRYSADEYEVDYEQRAQTVYSGGAPGRMILAQEPRRYGNERPSSDNKYLPYTKPKAPIPQIKHDYPLDYGARISGNNNKNRPNDNPDYTYSPDYSETIRNIEPAASPTPIRYRPTGGTRILAQSPPRLALLRAPVLLLPPPQSTGSNPSSSLSDIAKSLQLTNRLPEMLNEHNIDSSIRTLVEILAILNNAKRNDYQERPLASLGLVSHPPPPPQHRPVTAPSFPLRNPQTYHPSRIVYQRPNVVTESRFQATPSPQGVEQDPQNLPTRHSPPSYAPSNVLASSNDGIVTGSKEENFIEYYTPYVQDLDYEKPATSQPKLPSPRPIEIVEQGTVDPKPPGLKQYTKRPIQLPMTLEFGATRGTPNVDYPAHATIPETAFKCKDQRYKGFFGDPSTGCQVWHYCDLNGGKSSFLCPNGTIFSQVALTCDWWFNVECESTTQLYVLNERLYKYILPIMPKFPEDFSGPEVDRYLEIKFKEMEAKLKEKKLKKKQEKAKEKLRAQSNDEE